MINENYGDFLLALEREFKEDMIEFEIEEICIEYVFNNNDIEMMRMNCATEFGDEKEIIHMNMYIQANYKNRGIIKEIDYLTHRNIFKSKAKKGDTRWYRLSL
jgi:hypothetical protein